MKSNPYQIIQCLPGFFAVYELEEEKEIYVGEPIIAWRIETIEDSEGGNLSHCFPIVSSGDVCENCIAIQNPDMSINDIDGAEFYNLEEFLKKEYPEYKIYKLNK